MKLYRHRFAVTGTWPIPFDMLRYDACYPATEGRDASALERLSLPGGHRAAATVTFEHVGEKGWAPTVDRWASFMWCVEVSSHEMWPL